MERLKKNGYFICLGLIFILAFILRIKTYLLARPLWNDECALALNILDFNFINCFRTFNGQVVPPFFIIISEIFYKIIPNSELSLRFVPLISSILSLFVFYDLSKKLLIKRSSIIFALLLFCFNYQLIYYAQEFKQYSSDVLIFISIIISYFYLKITDAKTKNLICFGIIYALSIWFSFTSLFAIFTVLSLLILKYFKEFRKIIILSLPVIISFICFYSTQMHLTSDNLLHTYWQEGFINSNFSNFFQVFINYFIFAFNNIFLLLLFLVGIVLKTKDIKTDKGLLLIIPLLLAFFLAYFFIYPLSSRVSLYLIPVFILVIAHVIDYINFKNKIINYIFSLLIIFVCTFFVIVNSIYKININNFEYEDVITPLKIAKEYMQDKDILYISDGAEISYKFYKGKFDFKNIIIEKKRINNFNEYANFLDNLPKGNTYYYIFCHFPNKQQRLNNLYLWAKNKKNSKIYADKSFNALIIFTN